MSRQTITDRIATKYFLTKAESQRILQTTLNQIASELKKDGQVILHDFGSFTVRTRKPKRLRHPVTKKLMTVPSRTTIAFNPSKKLIQKIQAGRVTPKKHSK